MKKRLLFVSPVVPALTGSGVAMRASCMIEALARTYTVSLLVVPVIGGASGDQVDRRVTGWCENVQIVRLRNTDTRFERIMDTRDPAQRLASLALYPRPVLFRFATPKNVQCVNGVYRDSSFDTVHVFRLYAAPFAQPFLESVPRPTWWLDLDEIESESHKQVASVHALQGDDAAASLAKAEALKYAREERNWLPRFERVFVSSRQDVAFIAARYQGIRVSVIPNAVRLPETLPPEAHQDDITLLFVGSMAYAPNEDAAIFFCRDILPRIRSHSSARVCVMIVGNNPTERVRALSRDPDIHVTGRVPNTSEYYGRAAIAVVPLRGGGGTRIKILEAFAHRCPVVSTSKGAEGLEVRNGEHLLIADAPGDFAEACVALGADSDLRGRLISGGLEWVRSRHTVEAVARCIP